MKKLWFGGNIYAGIFLAEFAINVKYNDVNRFILEKLIFDVSKRALQLVSGGSNKISL